MIKAHRFTLIKAAARLNADGHHELAGDVLHVIRKLDTKPVELVSDSTWFPDDDGPSAA